jgi:hypothetical protein
MGRPKRHRERIQSQLESVRAKNINGILVRTLKEDFGCSRVESEVLAGRSTLWLASLGAVAVPGEVRLSVPATQSRKYSRARRTLVTVSAVSVGEDTEVWEAYGLAVMQRRRILRWLYEIFRQGGWGSLKEVAAWANLTPTALGARLRLPREHGVWLPHVGGPPPDDKALALEPWLIDRYLTDGVIGSFKEQFGLAQSTWEALMRRFTRVVGWDCDLDTVAHDTHISPLEAEQMVQLAEKHRRNPLLTQLLASYSRGGDPSFQGAIERELVEEFGLSPLAARLFHNWLREFAARMGRTLLQEGEMLFFAVSAAEGPRAELAEAEHVAVRLKFFTAADGEVGLTTQVSKLKFDRILRYATEARAQGALLTLPDIAVIMGIHADTVQRHLAARPDVVVPTRGRVKDIGPGITHKAEIVELYLSMHTETEIVERTGHSYESVEAYLREFARIVILSDKGMNTVMIRRVTGRSMSLVEAYLELYKRYNKPDYYFRLGQLKNVFARDELLTEKGGPSTLSPIGGADR